MDTKTMIEQARRLDKYLTEEVSFEDKEDELLIPMEQDWKETVEGMRDYILFFLSKYD